MVTPRPLLIVCLREPVAQHVSWWQLEQSGMQWGTSMGLGDTWLGPPVRLEGYPPASFGEAIDLSRSPQVVSLWDRAEALPWFSGADQSFESPSPGSHCLRFLSRICAPGPVALLPDWAVPFPNGQLSAFDRMGRYADSIERWRKYFGEQ